MPCRNGYSVSSGWANSTMKVNNQTFPADLSITNRSNNTPAEYTAANSITFTGEYEDGGTDEYMAYIIDPNNLQSSSPADNSSDANSNVTGSSDEGYRYGFNGKEKDNDIYGEGNAYNFDNRIQDPRLGRWFSLDPLQKKYPDESNYAFTSDNPIIYKDADGKDKYYTLTIIYENGSKSILTKDIDKNYSEYSSIHGYDNDSYYKTDLYINLTVDLRGNNINVTRTKEVVTKKTSDRVYATNLLVKGLKYVGSCLGILGDNKEYRGKTKGGYTLTSEFSKNGDGAKTDATEGSSGSINVDLIQASAEGWADFLELPEDVEFINQMKGVVEKAKEVSERAKEKEEESKTDQPKPTVHVGKDGKPDGKKTPGSYLRETADPKVADTTKN